MNDIVIQSIRLIGIILLQILIFGQIEVFGIHPMVYPLFIFLLPFSIRIVSLLFIAFFSGLLIDIFSNTGGLHTSSLLIFALIRPLIFHIFRPRDGYEQFKEGSIYQLGNMWFFYCFGILIIFHHTWFFFLEVFKWDELLYAMKKIVLTLPVTYFSVILLQYLFIRR